MRHIAIKLAVWFLVSQAAMLFAAPQKPPNSPAWSSSNPLTIPYERRITLFRKGNLTPNPSFEKQNSAQGAKISRKGAFAAQGWTRVGENVQEVDADKNPFSPAEVDSGRHAVKIVRNVANETDAAEGVLSDYIPVIPGNYDFTYAVRLKDVAGNRRRMGARLDDAVTVKVLFFDARKQPLDPKVLNPVSGRIIDTSNKSYSFSAYWRIDDFPWARVAARSGNYPFSEGDLPDRTRFVRLFLGLKGSGLMWIDAVDFRFSKWNFTAIERLSPFIEKPLETEKSLIPTPRQIRILDDIVYYAPGNSDISAPLIVLPAEPGPADISAARLLQEKLDAVMNRAAAGMTVAAGKARVVAGRAGLEEGPENRLVFSIGNTFLLRSPAPDPPLSPLPDHPEGYAIESRKVGPWSVVFLMGATPIGNFNAAATAVQLLDDTRCIFSNAAVRDYPDFTGRSYVFPSWGDSSELKEHLGHLQRMAAYKLNKVYVGKHGRTPLWHRPEAVFQQGIAEIGRACKESGVMGLAMMVNPYAHFEFMSSAEGLNAESRYTWTHGDPRDLDMLKNVFRVGLDSGAGTIMLLADDYVPHEGKNLMNFSLYTPEDKKRFINLQNAQAHVINRLKEWVDETFPGTRFEFCPPWYANEFIDRSEGRAEVYFRELTTQIPEDVAIVWTGPTVRSLSIDMADLHRYRSLIGRSPMIWDNTLYARGLESPRYGGYPAHYPGKVRMCNLFEPFDGPRPDDFHTLNDGGHMYTNGTADGEIFRIKYATIADYEWNSAAYSPELSLWKVLVQRYGATTARQLLLFNHAYYGLYDACTRMEKAGAAGKAARSGARFLKNLEFHLGAVSDTLSGSHPLVKELGGYRDRQRERFEGLLAGKARVGRRGP